MADEEVHPTAVDSTQPRTCDRTNSPTTSSSQSNNGPVIHASLPIRPRLPSRKSSGPLVVPRDGDDADPVGTRSSPGDALAMSPKRTSEETKVMHGEVMKELKRYGQKIQGLDTISSRIEQIRDQYDKLDNYNKYLRDYIGTLKYNYGHCDG